MLKAIRMNSDTPFVIAQRDALVRDLPVHDQGAEARAIYTLTDNIIRYTEDPPRSDTFKWPEWVLEEYHARGNKSAADCATQTALVAALAQSLNIPVRLRIIGDNPRDFFHVHPELLIDGRWVAADVTATTAKSRAVRNRAGLGYRHPAPVERIYNV